MNIKVIDGGLQTIIVDLGRYGWYWQGLPPSGPMDRFSFMVGNILLGNDVNAASLECCYLGPTLEIVKNTCVTFTGAEASPVINNEIVPMWQVHQVKSGDVISFHHCKAGRWFYISFSGGIDVPLVCGARSTYLPGRLGGYKGRTLKSGDTLKLFSPTTHLSKVRGLRLEDKNIPSFREYNEVRVVFGLLRHLVLNIDDFCEATWELSTMDNRVGYRFHAQDFKYRWARQERGEPQVFGAAKNPCDTIIISYPVGSIQTDMWNEAIVVLQDATTGGAFAPIGTVIQCDQDTLAQAIPGDKVKFVAVSHEQALAVRKERFKLLNRIRESCF